MECYTFYITEYFEKVGTGFTYGCSYLLFIDAKSNCEAMDLALIVCEEKREIISGLEKDVFNIIITPVRVQTLLEFLPK